MRTIIEERGGILVLRTAPMELQAEAPSWVRKAKKKKERSERISKAVAWLLVKGWPWGLAFIIASGYGVLLGGVLRHVW